LAAGRIVKVNKLASTMVRLRKRMQLQTWGSNGGA